MPVEILDLQLIFGVDGARRKFEQLTAKLLKGKFADARAVRPKNGDEGVDVCVGQWTDPRGIDVYQCKWFPQGLGDPQKDQIRRSFQRCLRSEKFKLKTWTLCLPVNLSPDEISWFDAWRAKQAPTGVVIEDAWGADRLEGLLYEEKNRGIKEAFFKQEHLTQIRELHSLLPKLVESLETRLQADHQHRQQVRQEETSARQVQYLDKFLQAMRKQYAALTKPPLVSLKSMRELVRLGRRDLAQKYHDAHRRLGHWEVVIHPAFFADQTTLETLAKCKALVDSARLSTAHWNYPHPSGTPRTGHDWIGFVCLSKPLTEYWRISQHGVFAHLFPIFSDTKQVDAAQLYDHLIRGGMTSPRVLNVDEVMLVTTHVVWFARNLADQMNLTSENAVNVTIGLLATSHRPLITYKMGFPVECGKASEPQLSHTWTFARDELRQNADALGATAALWFYERFGWQHARPDNVRQLQATVLRGS